MGTCPYGYLELLISRNREKIAASLSALALVINCVFALFMVLVVKVSYDFVIIATMITYAFFSVLVIKTSSKLFEDRTLLSVIKDVMPLRIMVPYISALIISLLQIHSLIVIPLIVFFVLNTRKIGTIIGMVKKLLYEPEIVNLK